jgi:hypothetical protein
MFPFPCCTDANSTAAVRVCVRTSTPCLLGPTYVKNWVLGLNWVGDHFSDEGVQEKDVYFRPIFTGLHRTLNLCRNITTLVVESFEAPLTLLHAMAALPLLKSVTSNIITVSREVRRAAANHQLPVCLRVLNFTCRAVSSDF